MTGGPLQQEPLAAEVRVHVRERSVAAAVVGWLLASTFIAVSLWGLVLGALFTLSLWRPVPVVPLFESVAWWIWAGVLAASGLCRAFLAKRRSCA